MPTNVFTNVADETRGRTATLPSLIHPVHALR
jgi:hypothetical protein